MDDDRRGEATGDGRGEQADLWRRRQQRAATTSFFGPRAAGWDDRFGDDAEAFAGAVAALAPPLGGLALDAGCGTGRGVPWLARAVGPTGSVVAIDLTAEMLAALVRAGRDRAGSPVLADAGDLPIRGGTVDAVLAGGLLPHSADPGQCLRELARVTRAGGRLALFHPVGRATLAARHGRVLSDADPLSGGRIAPLLAEAGWALESLDDTDTRYLAVGRRQARAGMGGG